MPIEILYDIVSFLKGTDRRSVRQLNTFFYSLRARSRLVVRRLKSNQLDDFCKIVQLIGGELNVQFNNLVHPQLPFAQLISKLTRLTNIVSLSFKECNYHVNGVAAWNGLSNLISVTNLQINSRYPAIQQLEALTSIKKLSIRGYDVENEVNNTNSFISLPNLEDLEVVRENNVTFRHSSIKIDLNSLDRPYLITRLSVNVDQWDSMTHQRSKLTALKTLQIFPYYQAKLPNMEVSVTTLESLEFETDSLTTLKRLVDSNPRLRRLKCLIKEKPNQKDVPDQIFAKSDLQNFEVVDITVPYEDYVDLLPDGATAIGITSRIYKKNAVSDYKRFTRLGSLELYPSHNNYDFPSTLTALYAQGSSAVSLPLTQLPNLETCHVFVNLQNFADLVKLTKLENLAISLPSYGTEELTKLNRLTKFMLLNEPTENWQYNKLAQLTDLEELYVHRIKSDDQIHTLSTLRNLTKLFCVELVAPGFALTCLTSLQVFEAYLPEDKFRNKSIALTNYVLDKLPFCVAKINYSSMELRGNSMLKPWSDTL